MTEESTLRHSLPAEQSVLGAILLDRQVYDAVSGKITASDFYFVAHIWIFKIFGELAADGKPPELIFAHPDADEKLSDFGGVKYLAKLIETVPTTTNAWAYASLILECSVSRRVAAFGAQLIDSANKNSQDIISLIAQAKIEIDRLGDIAKPGDTLWWEPDTASVEKFITTRPPPREMIIPGLLPAGIVAILAAEGGTGKSYASIQMGICVALGLPLFGMYQTGEPSGVLIVFAEESVDEIWRRVYYLFHFMVGERQDLPALEALLVKNLHIKSMLGEDCLMTVLDGNVCKKTDLPERLVAVTKAYQCVRLLILDPIANMNGGEENNNSHATIFIQVLSWVGLQLGGVSILAVHHTNKASAAEQGLTQGAIRGAGAFVNAARLAILMRRAAESDEKRLGIPTGTHPDFALWKVVKGNYSPRQGTALLRQTSSGAFIHVEPKKQSALDEPTNAEIILKVRSIVIEHSSSGKYYTKTSFAQTFCTQLGVGENRLAMMIGDAITEGKIRAGSHADGRRVGVLIC
jgi:RecA-family ATPase